MGRKGGRKMQVSEEVIATARITCSILLKKLLNPSGDRGASVLTEIIMCCHNKMLNAPE